jgi:hypothetical protein
VESGLASVLFIGSFTGRAALRTRALPKLWTVIASPITAKHNTLPLDDRGERNSRATDRDDEKSGGPKHAFATCRALFVSLSVIEIASAKAPRHRPCDIAQDKPMNLAATGSNAVMFGACGGVRDIPAGEFTSRADWWNPYNCGYLAYRQGKKAGPNPYRHEDLKPRRGWLARGAEGMHEREGAVRRVGARHADGLRASLFSAPSNMIS